MLFNLREQIAKSLQCPDCNVDMDFLASLRTNRVFVSNDLRARVLSLSELPAPQPSTRGDAANTQSWCRLPSELLPAARSHAESCKTIEPKRRDEPQRGLAYNRGPT